MTVTRCDRCGKEFDPKTDVHFRVNRQGPYALTKGKNMFDTCSTDCTIELIADMCPTPTTRSEDERIL